MGRVIIACVGGFLGAGKTTALQAAARELTSRGLRVGIITNDQGTELVDTKVLEELDVTTKEIGGGCFCCKFDDLVEQAEQILDQAQPDIILAEAVGSCTDLSATVYQPLRKYYGHKFELAPLSVLVGADRIVSLGGDSATDGEFPDTVKYLFEKQMAEADLIVLNKVDTVSEAEAGRLAGMIGGLVGAIPLHRMSALTHEGVSKWVDILLHERTAGKRILDIDYDTYAQAEAALGWLNATVEITSTQDFSPGELAVALMKNLQTSAIGSGMNIAHLKILVATDTETDRIALTDNTGRPQWSDGSYFPSVRELSLVINARVHTTPEELTRITRHSLAESERAFGVSAKVEHLESFSPLPPKPRYRMVENTL